MQMFKKSDITIIFLAAGKGTRMLKVAPVPKPLLAIGDKAALSLMLGPIISYGFKNIAFVLGPDGHLIEYYMRSNYPNLSLSFHYIKEALGTAHSLYEVRHVYPSNPIMVCHADNIFLEEHFKSIDIESNFLFVNNDPVLKPYAYIKVKNGFISGAVEKPKERYSDSVISGLFYFTDSAKVWMATEFNFLKNKKSHTEWSLTDTVDTMVGEYGIPVRAHLVDTPVHFGTPESYEETIHAYDGKSEIIKRAMNKITIKEKDNLKIVRKESVSNLGSSNLSPEIAYLQNIPSRTKKHFPRLYEFSSQYYEMEYLPGVSLSDLAHKGGVNKKNFFEILSSVSKILKENFHFETRQSNKESIFYEYFLKTEAILRTFQSALKLPIGNVIINGAKCLNPLFIINSMARSRKIVETIQNVDFTIIHGDLNLTNVIYDMNSQSLRFIDPRGKYGNKTTIFGDPSYDLMRIKACVDYGYDTIVKGLYSLKVENKDIQIEVQLPELYLSTQENLKNLFIHTFPGIPALTYEIQSILYFLNLLPFHADSIERSLAYYYWGTYILNQSIKKQGGRYGIVH